MEARIACLPSERTLTAEAGGIVMDAIYAAGIPIASSCGGQGVCGDCRVRVVAGRTHLAAAYPDPGPWVLRHGEPDGEVLSCRVTATGPVTLATSYW